jgi:hypothetical protein
MPDYLLDYTHLSESLSFDSSRNYRHVAMPQLWSKKSK